MKRDIQVVLFVASIALNLVFAVTYIVFKVPSLAGTNQAVPDRPLFLQLDLSAGQISQFKMERDTFHTQLRKLGQEIKTRQTELIDLLEVTPPDQQAIERKQEEIQRLQGTVQDQVIVHFLRASSFLTPEQRTRFFQLVKARVETSVQACPPWMRSPGPGQPGETKK
jgi:Spy/CpxP family protein refolding chaperone